MQSLQITSPYFKFNRQVIQMFSMWHYTNVNKSFKNKIVNLVNKIINISSNLSDLEVVLDLVQDVIFLSYVMCGVKLGVQDA